MNVSAAAFRPHDIVRFDPSALKAQEVPGWWAGQQAAAAFAVIRRADERDKLLPIGIRGEERHQRWGGWLDRAAIIERLEPEALVRRIGRLPTERLAMISALAALRELTRQLPPAGLRWGPTGSVGFELASGRPTAKPSSDLDLIFRADTPIRKEDARSLLALTTRFGARCDMLLETPAGATALIEFADTAGPVVVRTATGPKLLATPWSKE
ncbi:malonate decarboxylase holo-ACP synthase [Rhizobium panacihumi]|uniref:malonate decarboxylase holo-ACP synthase n=1 Tax=Rhizobium panacihumi TaxID=2008450 RepID=UPI003D7BBACC